MGLLDIFNAVTPIVQKALDFIPDPVEKAKAQQELLLAQMQFAQTQMQAQTDINKAEATSNNVFIAGWRPAIGWCGAAGIAWTYVAVPAIQVVQAAYQGRPIPHVDTTQLYQLVLAMLGMGALRTIDKVTGARAGS